ncbi:adhesion G protein-coupled receptor E2 isoform X1 [Parasteatoda tepidariorum]|uniref:adhesion G protein-coupled receptor E2 isoform X1 n=1 Tax=Parasteatoda tepidariorum TaxID=114398 RepID=UPI001C71F778|nr:cadherin EGF LAG seven-pass G-type receptor 2 isoform X1 [Parasteatoda tepidariorum]
MAASSNIPQTRFYSSPMKLFVVALLSSLKNLDNSTSKLVFRPMLHQPRIYAGAPAGVHVTTVHAYDPEKPRTKVEYNLPNVLDYKNFVIDKMSGNLSTALPINKTVGETYQVMATAVSYNCSELEHLQIAVTEFNQFSPRFDTEQYDLEFHPKTEVGTIVLRVKATDPDPVPQNAEIYYLLDQNSTSQYFDLDPITGELSLNQYINDTKALKLFGIYAEDGGSPKRWAYVAVSTIIKHLSAPQNVTISNITSEFATVCWNPPMYGNVLGYVVKYYPFDSEAKFFFNMTVVGSSGDCKVLTELIGNTDYKMQLYAWNEQEDGQKSEIFHFHSAVNWCKKVTCETGYCTPLNEEPFYHCACFSGYYGNSCEFFDPCSQNPCENNGKCLNTTHNEYVCICAEDYSGPNCQSYNPCLRRQNPCENGATCEMTTTRNTYVCVCPEGFYGRKCKFRDLCASNPCKNGATCNKTENEFSCLCSPGFMGELCEIDIDECASDPCFYGSTCLNLVGNFTCVCSSGFSGQKCDTSVQCPAGRTDTDSGVYYWNATNHSTIATVKCPFGTLDTAVEAIASRECVLDENKASWSPVNASLCKGKGFIVADELANELNSITKNPKYLSSESLEAASQGIETISKYASQDKKLAEGLLMVISNIMEANESVIRKDENKTFSTFSESALQMVDDFASNVELKPGSSVNIVTPNVIIHSMEWFPEFEEDTESDHLELTAPTKGNAVVDKETTAREAHEDGSEVMSASENKTTPPTTRAPTPSEKVPVFQVFVPKEALQEAHRQMEGNVRVKFVIYYNDKLFQTKQNLNRNEEKPTEKEIATNDKSTAPKPNNQTKEKEINMPVLQISVGNVSLKNMNNPLIYVLPLKTSRVPTCVYWDEPVKSWSSEGLKTNQTETKIICQSSHLTAFSVLLDFTPQVMASDIHETILSIISYSGSALSIVGLSSTLLTYSIFGCLNRDHSGKILSNLCLSLLLMNLSFICLSFEPRIGGHVCALVALLLHYFVLTSLSWMSVEAINMYQLLVHVFASSETHFLLKRCLFAWGLPLTIVAVTASLKLEAYYSGLAYCMISPLDPVLYYCAFLGPCCIILATNTTVFLLVAKVIFTPRLTVKTSYREHPSVTVAQVRGAFTVMVLLGVTWVFGTLTVGRMKLFFQYFFCIANSLQGFLIFLVRCLLYPEARNAWIYLLKAGKLKKHRGIIPPGTVSYSNNSHCTKTPVISSQAGPHTDNGDLSPTVALDRSLFGRNGRVTKDNGQKEIPCAIIGNSLYEHGRNCKEIEENNPEYYNSWNTTNPKRIQKHLTRKGDTHLNHSGVQYYKKNDKIDLPVEKQLSIESSISTEESSENDKTFKHHNLFPRKNSKFSLKAYGKRKLRVALPKNDITTSEESLEKCKEKQSNENITALESPAKEGAKTILSNMKKRSNNQKKNKRNQFSNENAETRYKEKKGIPNTKKESVSHFPGYRRRASTVYEQEECNTDDSTSTDVEDSPSSSQNNGPQNCRNGCTGTDKSWNKSKK